MFTIVAKPSKTRHRSLTLAALVGPHAPTVLSLEEVQALIGAIRVTRYQAIVMVLYGAGFASPKHWRSK